MGPVVTVTLNPAIDRTVWVDELVPGTTHRTADARTTIGGKGINVARTVARLGAPVIALGIAGEDQAPSLEQHLAAVGVRSRFLSTPGETRTNLKLIEQATGRLTEINGSGPHVSADLIAAMEAELLSTVEDEGSAVVVLAGSLPVGIEPSVYAQWTRRLGALEAPVRVLVDASDEALELVVGAQPLVLKPNRIEAERLVGHAIVGDDGREAAAEITALGPRGVLLSLGPRGAAAAWGGETVSLPARPIQIREGHLVTTVGAGDAMVARLAVELAGQSEGEIGAATFFEMCRLAVAEAEAHIAEGAADTPVVSEPTGDGGRPVPPGAFSTELGVRPMSKS